MQCVVGAVAVALGIAVLATGHRLLAVADAGLARPAGIEVAGESGGAPGAVDEELRAERTRARA